MQKCAQGVYSACYQAETIIVSEIETLNRSRQSRDEALKRREDKILVRLETVGAAFLHSGAMGQLQAILDYRKRRNIQYIQ